MYSEIRPDKLKTKSTDSDANKMITDAKQWSLTELMLKWYAKTYQENTYTEENVTW